MGYKIRRLQITGLSTEVKLKYMKDSCHPPSYYFTPGKDELSNSNKTLQNGLIAPIKVSEEESDY